MIADDVRAAIERYLSVYADEAVSDEALCDAEEAAFLELTRALPKELADLFLARRALDNELPWELADDPSDAAAILRQKATDIRRAFLGRQGE